MKKMRVKFIGKKIEGGQSLLELALILLVLILLVVGIVDLGRFLYFYVTLRDAAQEGVVYGSIAGLNNQTECNNTIARSMSVLTSVGTDLVTIDVDVGPDGPLTDPDANLVPCLDERTVNEKKYCSGNEIKVTVKKPFPLTVPLLGAVIGSENLTLTTTARGTILRPDCP